MNFNWLTAELKGYFENFKAYKTIKIKLQSLRMYAVELVKEYCQRLKIY